jgi:hypothetical protein
LSSTKLRAEALALSNGGGVRMPDEFQRKVVDRYVMRATVLATEEKHLPRRHNQLDHSPWPKFSSGRTIVEADDGGFDVHNERGGFIGTYYTREDAERVAEGGEPALNQYGMDLGSSSPQPKPSKTTFTSVPAEQMEFPGFDAYKPIPLEERQKQRKKELYDKVRTTSGTGVDDVELQELGESVFDYTTSSGYEFKVSSTRLIEGWGRAVAVHGEIYAPDNKERAIGIFDRSFDFKANTVTHELFEINGPQQGEGLMTEWFDKVIPEYQELGIDTIEVHANISVGGYAWAKAGFEWNYPPEDIDRELKGTLWGVVKAAETHGMPTGGLEGMLDYGEDPDDEWDDFIELLTESFGDSHITDDRGSPVYFADRWKVTPAMLPEIVEMMQEAREGNISAFDFSQWLNEPEFRMELGGHTTWPGKEILLGSEWEGAMGV